MVKIGGGGKSTGSLVHSLLRWVAVLGARLAHRVVHTGAFTKISFLIYGTILRKNELTGSVTSTQDTLQDPVQLQPRNLRRIQFNFSPGIFAGSGSTSRYPKGVHSSPSKSVVAPQNLHKYVNLQMAVSWRVLVRSKHPNSQIKAQKLGITNITSMASLMRVKIIISSDKCCYTRWCIRTRVCHFCWWT